jgi:hypothetical protein
LCFGEKDGLIEKERNGTYPCDSDSSGLGIENDEQQLDEETLVVVRIAPGETADLRDDLVVWALLVLDQLWTK